MKVLKRCFIIFLFLIIISSMFFLNKTFANGQTDEVVDVMKGVANGIGGNNSKVVNGLASILAALQVSMTGISVVAVSYYSIRYFVASTAQQKNNYKGGLIYSCIGGALIFASTSIMRIIFEVMNDWMFGP